ncbi:diguanylate cyclase with PAS/PAC and GAF sensors [Pseudodesulfovibrio mercurii]|uniref:Diguanylate cyclase with PAS/PAC and GAF sensors n=1 Tax=Pseudodesulfovibrio mercurii TaxID=641491 RepID=F0JEN3_9BACT|nr:diguanylate cyclase [Pseudodesulfovibrio mercurii]EGB14762.1 diguanylate cyclase with PAS/PAC and GAF sensors [Pseudodesulfovibrio mercurii]
MDDTTLRGQLKKARQRIAELEADLEHAAEATCEDRYHLVFENAPGGMAIITEEGQILLSNAEAKRFLGLSEQDGDQNAETFYVNVNDRNRLLALLRDQQLIRNFPVPMRRLDGTPMWASLSARSIDYGGIRANLISFTDITEHREALRRLELDEIRFEKLYALSEMTQHSESDILDFALEAITEVTGSEIGYIYRLNEDESVLTLHAWSKGVMGQCTLKDVPEIYHLQDTGLWGEPVRLRRPVLTNDYPGLTDKRGYPEGHIPVRNHLGVPVFDEDRIVLLAGVGNKPGDFTEDDVRHMELIMNGTWRIVQRRRSRAELSAAHAELEEKVRRRTDRLQQVNRELAGLNLELMKKDSEREQARTELMRYQRIIETNPDLISLIDGDYRYVIVNQSYTRIFGLARESIVGQPVGILFGTQAFEEQFRPAIDRALEGETLTEATWLHLPDQGERYMSITYQPVKVEGDDTDYVSFEARDMTDLKRSEEDLKAIAERLDLATDAAHLGIWEWDLRTDDLLWDHKMFDLYQAEPMPSRELFDYWRSCIHPDDLAATEYQLARSIETKEPLYLEFRIVRPDGVTRHIRLEGLVQVDDKGMPIRLIGISMDVTEQRKMEDELRTLASTDPLTGASNRRQFMSRLSEEFERCKRYNTSLVLLSLDIDHFKRINDTFGHPAGDDVLKELVALCRSTLRTTDLFGRVGGEEFQAALTQTRIGAGENTAERLRRRVERCEVKTHGETITFTISIGVTALRPEDGSIEGLLKRADDALYQAKRNGRNRVMVL